MRCVVTSTEPSCRACARRTRPHCRQLKPERACWDRTRATEAGAPVLATFNLAERVHQLCGYP